MTASSTPGSTLPTWHEALLYRSAEEYVHGVLDFLRSAAERRRPTFVAVPGPHADLLREGMNGEADAVRFADMRAVGRNPNRIIAAIHEFVDQHRGRGVSFVGEPIWAGRSTAEISEATRHEALINTAFADAGAEVLCPYDTSRLPTGVLEDAHRTHPVVLNLHQGARRRSHSDRYTDPTRLWESRAHLPAPPPGARCSHVAVTTLSQLRVEVRSLCAEAGMPRGRTDDAVLAVTELAGNSIRHGGGAGVVTMWREPDAVVFDVSDGGFLGDPLAGRLLPDRGSEGGRGLWLVNQVCDLVQIRSDATGTTVRIRLSLLG